VTEQLFAAFLRVVEVMRPAFDPRVFVRLLVVLIGWVRTTGRHAITEALLVTGVAQGRDWSAFHRVFSTARWDLDEVGRRLLGWILARWGDGPLRLVVDDTLAPHKGPHVFGLGCYLDAVHSTRRTRLFRFGHEWVVLSVVVPLPFAATPWALPLLFRLYRPRADCTATGDTHRTKPELAREMLDRVVAWVRDRGVEVAADQAYSNGPVVRGLPARVVWFGALRPDAALTAAPTAPRRKKGAPLPTPAALAADDQVPWSHTRVALYGRRRTVAYKTCVAQWYHALGPRLLRVVVVRCTTGTRPLRVFFCTDPTVSVPALLVGYAERWPTEPTFRESKQLLGFAQSSAWTEDAVRRTAPMAALLYTVLALWFHECRLGDALDVIPSRPWYPAKCTVSFADVLRVAQETFARIDLPTKLPVLQNLARRGPPSRSPVQLPLPFAA
jgi:hypothetical protein